MQSNRERPSTSIDISLEFVGLEAPPEPLSSFRDPKKVADGPSSPAHTMATSQGFRHSYFRAVINY